MFSFANGTLNSYNHTMKRTWIDILACPVCKTALNVTVDEEEDTEIIAGSLACSDCGDVYPIVDSIPNLLPKSLREKE
jgi:uncharacterized protein YbaR (Trm112 family)